jgi:hypothetical protein
MLYMYFGFIDDRVMNGMKSGILFFFLLTYFKCLFFFFVCLVLVLHQSWGSRHRQRGGRVLEACLRASSRVVV